MKPLLPLPPPYALWQADHQEAARTLHERVADLKAAARALAPDAPDRHLLHHELGQYARLLGEAEEAAAHYRRALEILPGFAPSRLALAQLCMMQTNFREGLESYDLRWQADRQKDWRDFPAARWQGEPVAGKRVFIWAEQGLGDVVMFAAFLPYLLAQKPVKIVVGMFPKLITLLERSFPEVNFEPRLPAYDTELYQGLFDFVLPMGDLLTHCLPHYTPARHRTSFLRPDPARVDMAKKALGRLPGRKIGISWFTTNSQNSLARNIPLEMWGPILRTPGCHFFSLQHRVTMEALNEFSAKTNLRLLADPRMEPFRDTENLAAMIACMDGIISVQNANVHLGGALGVPTTLLLSHAGDFRWPPEMPDNPWYPSVTLLRQRTALEWGDVIRQAAEKLQQI